EGLIDREMIWRTAARNVLLVCSGNTCRSPMAEVLLRRMLAKKRGVAPEALLENGFFVHSAGVSAVPGIRPTPEAEGLAASLGLDLRGHRARLLTPEVVRAADDIFAMTAQHRRDVLALAPEAAERVQMLDPEGRDVRDPIGGTLETYRACMEELERALQ